MDLKMKWNDMLTIDVASLRAHYASVRELAFNNANMAQGTRPGGRTRGELANQMGYLMTQVSMCENAARQRKISLVETAR